MKKNISDIPPVVIPDYVYGTKPPPIPDITFLTESAKKKLKENIIANKDNRPITDTKVRHETVIPTLDADWVSSAFMVSSNDLEDIDAVNRYWSSANVKFTDTRAGGNIGINAKPQFTRYSDIRVGGKLIGRRSVSLNSRGNHGMGRYYSEAIDDNEQMVFMEFGVPEFNSLTRFFSLAIDPNAAFTANTGRANVFRGIGKLAGNVLMLTTFPILSIAIWTTQLASHLLPASSSKFYSLKPTMYLYWSMVNALTTSLTVDLGIFPASLTGNKSQKLGLPMKTNGDQFSVLQKLMPDVFSDNKFMDIFAIANRAQILSQDQTRQDFELKTKGSTTLGTGKSVDWEGYLKSSADPNVVPPVKGEHSFSSYIDQLSSLSSDISLGYLINDKLHKEVKNTVVGVDKQGKQILGKADIVATTEVNKAKLTKPKIDHKAGDKSWWGVTKDWMGTVGKYFDAQVRDGAAFATFYVEYTGSTTESFSTSVKDPAVKSILNTTSGTARDIKFNLAGGDIGFGPIGKLVKYGSEAISSFISGGLSSVTFGLSNVISALLGGGYIDVPKQWEDSTVSLPKISYTMHLVTTYGNDISLLQNIYIPLCMMLAGALPIATGKASYTSPFLCSLYDRGKQHIKLGIIDSLSITRGTTNLGYTKQGKPLGVDITFSVLDLSSIMAVPISDGGLFGLDMTLDEDHLLSTYLNVITGRSLFSQRYLMVRTKYRLAKTIFKAESAMSPARMGMMTGDSIIGELFSGFATKSALIPR